MGETVGFAIDVQFAAYKFSIKGLRTGAPHHDGAYGYDLDVLAEGLSLHLMKTFHPADIDAFLDRFSASQRSTNPVELSLISRVTQDFRFLLTAASDGGRLDFALRHGHHSMWEVRFKLSLMSGGMRAQRFHAESA